MPYETYKRANLLRPVEGYQDSTSVRTYSIHGKKFIEDESGEPLFDRLKLFHQTDNITDFPLILRGEYEHDPRSTVIRTTLVTDKMSTLRENLDYNPEEDYAVTGTARDLGIVAVGEELEMVRAEDGVVTEENLALRGILIWQKIRGAGEDAKVITTVKVYNDSESEEFKQAAEDFIG